MPLSVRLWAGSPEPLKLKSLGQDQGDEMSPKEARAEREATEWGDGRS